MSAVFDNVRKARRLGEPSPRAHPPTFVEPKPTSARRRKASRRPTQTFDPPKPTSLKTQ